MTTPGSCARTYSRAQIAATSPPRGHLHIDGTLRQPGVLRPKQPLGRVHFPCRRPTLEAAVVLLADELGVPTNAPRGVWRAAVSEHQAQPARLCSTPDLFARSGGGAATAPPYGVEVWTHDEHFRGLPGVRFVEAPPTAD